ncbi:3-dehydroquinate synthase [bacterium]|nr:3-dehydroquinate synthase [bacterium]
MKIDVNLGDRSYPIIIQNNLLQNLDEYLRGNVFVVTNTTVNKLYGKYLKKHAKKIIVIKDGEKYKNLATFEYISNQLLASKIERKDTIVALGGGVVGDITGYVASSVLRGVNFIQIPTTLLAQVDSSVGGKVAVNTKYGKNLLGAFYQPKCVLIDPNVLKTLPERQIKTGLAEVVKYAFIEKTACNTFDESFTFFDFLSTKDYKQNYENIIARSCQIKADVVSADEHESNLRAILNLGHTLCHALEKLTNFKITHGEGVSIGLKFIFDLSLKLGLIEKEYYENAIQLLNSLGLKTDIPRAFKADKIIELMKSDKKVVAGEINFVVPCGKYDVMRKVLQDELLIKEILP